MKADSTIRRAIRRLRARINESDDLGSAYAYIAESVLLWALEDERRMDVVADVQFTADVHATRQGAPDGKR